MEQDIQQLRDELTIAKVVHDYRNKILGHNIADLPTEEARHIAGIKQKKEQIRQKEQEELLQEAQRLAQSAIEEEEKKNKSSVKKLDKKLKEMLEFHATTEAEQEKRRADFTKQIEKLKKKKAEDLTEANKLQQEMEQLEDSIASCEVSKKMATEQFEALKELSAAGRQEMVQLLAAPAEERAAWLETRQKARQTITEKKVNEGDCPADHSRSAEVMGKIQEYIASEKEAKAKLEEEKVTREANLKKLVEAYQAAIVEHQQREAKVRLLKDTQEAAVEGMLQYLQQGCTMTKVPPRGSAKKRFVFLSEDCRKLYTTEVDETGAPVERENPTTSIGLKDVRRIVLGQSSAVFQNFVKDRRPREMDEEDGSLNSHPTKDVTPHSAGRYYYRSLTLEFKKDKTMDMVLHSDVEFEGWVCCLQWIFETGRAKVEEVPPLEFGTPYTVPASPGLDADDREFCSKWHVPPAQFNTVKQVALQAVTEKGGVGPADVRRQSSLDLFRCQKLLAYLASKQLVP